MPWIPKNFVSSGRNGGRRGRWQHYQKFLEMKFEAVTEVTDVRSVSVVEIKLPKASLDTSDKGYQPSLDESLVKEQHEVPEEKTESVPDEPVEEETAESWDEPIKVEVFGSPTLSPTTPVNLELPVKLLRVIHSPAQSTQYDSDDSQQDEQDEREQFFAHLVEAPATEETSATAPVAFPLLPSVGTWLMHKPPTEVQFLEADANKDGVISKEAAALQPEAPTNDWKLLPSVGTWCMMKIAEEELDLGLPTLGLQQNPASKESGEERACRDSREQDQQATGAAGNTRNTILRCQETAAVEFLVDEMTNEALEVEMQPGRQRDTDSFEAIQPGFDDSDFNFFDSEEQSASFAPKAATEALSPGLDETKGDCSKGPPKASKNKRKRRQAAEAKKKEEAEKPEAEPEKAEAEPEKAEKAEAEPEKAEKAEAEPENPQAQPEKAQAEPEAKNKEKAEPEAKNKAKKKEFWQGLQEDFLSSYYLVGGGLPWGTEAEADPEMEAQARVAARARDEARWKLLEEKTEEAVDLTLREADLPWPSGPVENPLRIDPEGHAEVVRSQIRAGLLRWHPDKFEQKFGRFLPKKEEERVSILARVKAIAQQLTRQMVDLNG